MIREILLTATLLLASVASSAWTIFPTPQKMRFTGGHSRCTEIQYVESKRIPKDGYSIRITGRKIMVKYSTAGGRLYSRKTLDLLKADGYPCCVIKDSPRCSWRGLMLDSGRQYQSVETIKSMLDLLFKLKMNVFHWHLTEGLGWRLEIKQYPELTSKGAYVSDGPEQQGYYTQEEVREIVRYAADRNITVVPEIDIPGHAEERTFSFEDAYLRNPADAALSENSPMMLGMECALWTDYNLTEDMLDSRLFPRIYALAELMWRGRTWTFDKFSERIVH